MSIVQWQLASLNWLLPRDHHSKACVTLLCTISPSFQYTIQVIVAKQEKATIISDEHQRCTATFTVRFHSSVIFASTSQTAASLRKFVKDQQATAWEVSKCMKIQAALKLPSWVKLSQVAFWCDSTISSLLLSTSSSRCLSFSTWPTEWPHSGHGASKTTWSEAGGVESCGFPWLGWLGAILRYTYYTHTISILCHTEVSLQIKNLKNWDPRQ